MKPNGILWDPWGLNTEILSNLIMPKIHEPINLIQGIPVKDAIGDDLIVLMMPILITAKDLTLLIFKGVIAIILISALIPMPKVSQCPKPIVQAHGFPHLLIAYEVDHQLKGWVADCC